MSYCRLSDDSDIYVYAHCHGYYECCGCIRMDEWESYHAVNADRMFSHMLRHVRAGDKVPRYALLAMASEVDREWKGLPKKVRAAHMRRGNERFFNKQRLKEKKVSSDVSA